MTFKQWLENAPEKFAGMLKYDYLAKELAKTAYLAGYKAAQPACAVDVASVFCNCVDPHFDLVEKCSKCGKPPRH